MIDKNDVKMPVPKKDLDIKGEGKVKQIEELLRLVNEADNKQELRLKQDYYSRFHWFGSDIGRDADKSYFSYQEEAAYDFVFNLNKSGILSDQVGMGKTIEAGMIISELASRNELRSLLIIVPNEILAQKWEYELAEKFGIQEDVRVVDGVTKVYPSVKALKNMNDFYRCVFDCICKEKFVEYDEYDFKHTSDPNRPVSVDQLIAGFIKEDIKKAVELINNGFEIWEMPGKPKLVFDGSSFSITGTSFKQEYKYDQSGEISKFVKGRTRVDNVSGGRFTTAYRKLLKQELEAMFVVIGSYFATIPGEISAVAQSMVNNNPILVIPIAYSEHKGDNIILHEFLNRILLKEMKDYKHKYNVFDTEGKIKTVYEDYKVVDFFIDVGYQTIIVDEVHDYIDVASKMERSQFHNVNGYNQYPSSEYNRYELFDDYYFIKKSSLYKKLKNLADKASRKIFLTATPIKSDMVDFYLLTLLASNKDAESYRQISKSLEVGDGFYATKHQVEDIIDKIFASLKECIAPDYAPTEFCKNPAKFLKEEKRDDATAPKEANRIIRCVYPYFNNTYLRTHLNDARGISKYLESHIAYMSVEEVLMELIIAYNAETQTTGSVSGANVFDKLQKLLDDETSDLQTRVVFRAILNNTIKLRFEEDFTKEDGTPIKRIRELLEVKDGARRWHKTYRKYGIRHTRHQTYNLNDCEYIEKLNRNKIEKFRNLPIWPKRDGKVIYLMRDDVFFDCLINARRELPKKAAIDININDIPNIDKMTGSDEVKAERFENANKIFDYINNSMSGGDSVYHLPQFHEYDSVDLDDNGMVDFKLALVNNLMLGNRSGLGSINKKVLLFAEHDRDAILEWFRYQKLEPLCSSADFKYDEGKAKSYKEKWHKYNTSRITDGWMVSDNTEDLNKYDGNLLIIIDPKRYEKGVDLQKADTIINFDINYDPLKMEQRIGRIDRIRPKGNSSEINIISFVPLNNMSGFVINFFAYELKMFTQWMGETTGIVSVPDESTPGSKAQQVSFSGKVYDLEKYYNHLYKLCGGKVEKSDIHRMAKEFNTFFPNEKFDENKIACDFEFLNALRGSFDSIFRNSISPQRKGYGVDGSSQKVMRFNSSYGVFLNCGADNCDKCPNKQHCRSGEGKRNISKEFAKSVEDFFKQSEKFYKEYADDYNKKISAKTISGGQSKETQAWLRKRQETLNNEKNRVMKALSSISNTDSPFTIPYLKYEDIFNPIKKFYWDEVAGEYMNKILEQFYKQCDSVLSSASLFENFIKILSIADFMKNMEGNV